MNDFYCEDASLVARNQEAMEAARRKMQEDLDAKAVLFKEKQKQVSLRADVFDQERSDLSSRTAKNKPRYGMFDQREEEKRKQKLDSLQYGKSSRRAAKQEEVSVGDVESKRGARREASFDPASSDGCICVDRLMTRPAHQPRCANQKQTGSHFGAEVFALFFLLTFPPLSSPTRLT